MGQGIFLTQSFNLLGNVQNFIAVHLDHSICNVEKGSGTAGHKNGGNSSFFIKVSGSFQERSDRLFFPADHFLHKRIPDHKVCGRSVFIQKEQFCTCLHAFYNAGGLRGTSAGILCGKAVGIFFIRQIVDKQRNIYIFNKTSVF